MEKPFTFTFPLTFLGSICLSVTRYFPSSATGFPPIQTLRILISSRLSNNIRSALYPGATAPLSFNPKQIAAFIVAIHIALRGSRPFATASRTLLSMCPSFTRLAACLSSVQNRQNLSFFSFIPGSNLTTSWQLVPCLSITYIPLRVRSLRSSGVVHSWSSRIPAAAYASSLAPLRSGLWPSTIFLALRATISLFKISSSAEITPGKSINSPRPRTRGLSIRSDISLDVNTAPAFSKGVAGTHEGNWKNTCNAISSELSSI